MKICSFWFCLLISVSLWSQGGYYSPILEYQGTEFKTDPSYIQSNYLLNNEVITEYYCSDSKTFVCFFSPSGKFDYLKLNFIKKNKSIQKSIKVFGLKDGLKRFFDRIEMEMTSKEVASILGVPNSTKYIIDGNDQLLKCYYSSGIYESLIFRNDYLERINYL